MYGQKPNIIKTWYRGNVFEGTPVEFLRALNINLQNFVKKLLVSPRNVSIWQIFFHRST